MACTLKRMVARHAAERFAVPAARPLVAGAAWWRIYADVLHGRGRWATAWRTRPRSACRWTAGRLLLFWTVLTVNVASVNCDLADVYGHNACGGDMPASC